MPEKVHAFPLCPYRRRTRVYPLAALESTRVDFMGEYYSDYEMLTTTYRSNASKYIRIIIMKWWNASFRWNSESLLNPVKNTNSKHDVVKFMYTECSVWRVYALPLPLRTARELHSIHTQNTLNNVRAVYLEHWTRATYKQLHLFDYIFRFYSSACADVCWASRAYLYIQ